MAAGKPIIATFSMGYSFFDHFHIGTQIYDARPHQIADEILKYYNLDEDQYNKICNNVNAVAQDYDYPRLTFKLKEVLDANI